jgi:hypothetical protein
VLGCALCSVWSTGWVMKGYCVLCRSVVCVVGVYVLCLMPFRKDWLLTDDVVGLPHCITLFRMRDRNYCMAAHATSAATTSLDYYGMHATHNERVHMD